MNRIEKAYPAQKMFKKLLYYPLLTSCLLLSSTYVNAQFQDGNTNSWGDIEYKGDPWVYNVSRPNAITEGLMDRHISLWASHGRYYDSDRKNWKWQRPNIFCTTEDLFTQTIVVPFLIPMLENAGANVFTPRERDWQINEIIIDNDDSDKQQYYTETEDGKKWKNCDSVGFANKQSQLQDGDNPFTFGSIREIKTTKRKHTSSISYQPDFSEAGKYAVYISYCSLPKSVTDAKYIVYHKGVATEFTVNQRMGDRTWVYLGTFDFDKGCNTNNRVVVSNQASKKGIVTSDAVRFGGGLGNINRGESISGLPRCLEGARYYAQWAGMPYSVYGGRKGKNDYADDINTRSFMTNYLAGGSCYMPTINGLKVPIELSLAIHSDAGFDPNGKNYVGSLAICTTDFNDGVLNSGISRQTSKDFASALLNNTTKDITAIYKSWNKRYLWDKNYSETRLPEVPSAILETLSHQNFPDMKLAQDPMFKFTIARSIYKTILRFVSSNHGSKYTVQPLAPKNFSVSLDTKGVAHLKWIQQYDSIEPTAKATSFNVYTSSGDNGFNNGTNIKSNSCNIQLQPNKQYNFKITACNNGGESFPSETLSAFYTPQATKTILVVNAFHRLASPEVIDNDSVQGFDIDKDAGVSYGLTAGWNGHQRDFDKKKMGVEGPGGLGYGDDDMVGRFVAGNDFNYSVTHTEAIAGTRKYNVVSCSSETILDGSVSLTNYPCIDFILGLERNDGYTTEYYKSFTPKMQSLINNYCNHGGNIIVSGAYIGSDMQNGTEKDFLKSALHVEYLSSDSDSIAKNEFINGLGMQFAIYNQLNPTHYADTNPEKFAPVGNAICAMQYSNGTCAAVGCQGRDRNSFVMGFPFECIRNKSDRLKIMSGILNYVISK